MVTREDHALGKSSRVGLARIFVAFADPMRLRMLNLLFHGEFSAAQLAQTLGVEMDIVLKHLLRFRESDLIVTCRKGHITYYSVRIKGNDANSRLLALVVELLEQEASPQADLAMITLSSRDHQIEEGAAESPTNRRGLFIAGIGGSP